MVSMIQVRGAREHNLKNISVDIPKNKLIVITGLSGSGKSSLAFDTIYAEGQRRYVESLSAYARQFLQLMKKPDVDTIEGLAPAISIEQKTTSKNPRSTVGTVTEIYDYLRLLFARVGIAYSPTTGLPIQGQTVSQMVDAIIAAYAGARILLLAPIARGDKGTFKKELAQLGTQGFSRVVIDGTLYNLEDAPTLRKEVRHHIAVVVDRVAVKEDVQGRMADSIETALALSDGLLYVQEAQTQEQQVFSSKFSCPESGFSLDEIEPRLFSFNSPHGACAACAGLGVDICFDPDLVVPDHSKSILQGAIAPWSGGFSAYFNAVLTAVVEHFGERADRPFGQLKPAVQEIILYGSGKEVIRMDVPGSGQQKKPFLGVIPTMERRFKSRDKAAEEMDQYQSAQPCSVCQGARLNPQALCVKIDGLNVAQVTALPISQARDWVVQLDAKLSAKEQEIAHKILKELQDRLGFLINVGLNYLHLSRASGTLSGGESQRIRLASQIGSGLTGVLYVLDEPSIGLHQRDNDRLLEALKRLRDLENTVIVVEHDEDAIRAADYIIDMGPGAGVHGGEIVAQGQLQDVLIQTRSLTAQYLTGVAKIEVPAVRRSTEDVNMLTITGARVNNLKNLTVSIPLGKLVCVTGVSGGGKSSLVMETLYKALAREKNGSGEKAGAYDQLIGLEHIDKIIDIDQSPIGRTPRSNPATYTGLFTPLRDWFANLPESKARGYGPGRFSFNVKGGRCEACQGDGLTKIEMHFLPDVYVTCDQCRGKRYNRETLAVTFKDRSISDILDMTVEEGVSFFAALPSVREKLKMLQQVGLDYIQIGQSATTLSGGEAQRIKLAKELSKRATGKTLYILDEPTTGLHFEDIRKLLQVLNALVEQGNTVLVIEHNLDVIKTADWIIDMGPEGGEAGGYVVATGTPEVIAQCPESATGRYLRKYLADL